jgi:hypothetical protein
MKLSDAKNFTKPSLSKIQKVVDNVSLHFDDSNSTEIRRIYLVHHVNHDFYWKITPALCKIMVYNSERCFPVLTIYTKKILPNALPDVIHKYFRKRFNFIGDPSFIFNFCDETVVINRKDQKIVIKPWADRNFGVVDEWLTHYPDDCCNCDILFRLDKIVLYWASSTYAGTRYEFSILQMTVH